MSGSHSKRTPVLHQSATGEFYYWSDQDQCYVFQSGRRVTRNGDQLQPVQPAYVPRYSTTPATPGAARGDSSTASTGSQSPEYTFRGRTQSFTSANGSDGYSSQYAATQAHGRPSQNYMVNSASAHVVQASYQGASNLPGSMTALTLGTHGQSSEYAQRPTVQAGQAAGLPQGRDWYQTNRSGRRPSINYSESNSQPGASGPSSLHPHLRRAFRATSGEYEELDPRYKKRPSKWFKPMRVFKMHWSEPSGRDNDDNKTVVTYREAVPKKLEKTLPVEFVRDRKFGQYIYSKIRWFIVIRASKTHCQCVPIVTYQNQGVAKAGVIKNEHAIVHTSKTAPDPYPDEEPQNNDEKPLRTPIRVQPDEKGDQLMEKSRIDYGRIYTVEGNVKAMAFGWVHKDSEKDLVYGFRDVNLPSDGRSQRRSNEDQGESQESADESDSSTDNDDHGAGNQEARPTATHPKGKTPLRPLANVVGASNTSRAQTIQQSLVTGRAASVNPAFSSPAMQRPAAALRTAQLPVAKSSQIRSGGYQAVPAQSSVAGESARSLPKQPTRKDESEEEESDESSAGSVEGENTGRH